MNDSGGRGPGRADAAVRGTMMNAETKRVYDALDWMIATMQWHNRIDDPHANEEWGVNGHVSPELAEAIAVREALEGGQLRVELDMSK